MRNSFINELTFHAEENKEIFLIVGDVGYGVIENFEKKFPNQFLNAGVAEQNMMGMAAGLASAGYQVFVYSIGNFPVFRCLEQIRNDICYQELNVSIVSVGAGLSYGPLGYSHHAIDDIGVMNALPGMTIYSPADSVETRIALRSSISIKTPKYFRLGRGGEPIIYDSIKSNFPNWTSFFKGDEVLVLTTGAIAIEVLEAAKRLESEGVNISVYVIPILKPFHLEAGLIEKFHNVIVVEEHSMSGGLGSIVSEQIVLTGLKINLVKLGIPDLVHHEIGSQKYLRSYFNIDSRGIMNKIREILQDYSNR